MLPFQINDLYKFYYTHPTNGLVQVYPANNSLSFQWKREKGQIFFRKDLTTTLNFIGDDFKELYRLDRSNYRCEKLNFEIHRKCGEAYSLYWTGYLALIDGDFDVTKCKVSIKPRIEDKYSCLMQGWKKEKDYIGGVGAPPAIDPGIKLTEGNVQFIDCTLQVNQYQNFDILPDVSSLIPYTDCLSEPLDSWSYLGYDLTFVRFFTTINETTGAETLVKQWSLVCHYAREVKPGTIEGSTPVPPSGGGWYYIPSGALSSMWARPININSDLAKIDALKNGRWLKDVLNYLVSDCGLHVVSDFLNISPDNTAPNNDAYDYAALNFKEIAIFQKSDIRRAKPVYDDEGNVIPIQPATKAAIVLQKLLENLHKGLNVYWDIIDDVFRIEHITYWQQRNLMLNLTQDSLKHRIAGLHRYKYLKEEVPIKETWSWMEKTDNNGDFDGLPIEYNEYCSFGDESSNEVDFQCDIITTNVEYIILNSDKIADAGNVLICTRNNGILSDIGRLSNQYKINGALGFANLMYHLQRYGRPQISGKLNGLDEAFFTKLRTRSQEGITLQLCCDDLATFDPQHSVKTQLGWGDVESATLTDPQSIIKLNLVHE